MSSVMTTKQEKERKAQAFERRKERGDRRKPTALHPSATNALANGAENPEFDENGAEPVDSTRVTSRSMSPAAGRALETSSISSTMNGRPSSPMFANASASANKATDSFLNYFFGKDGAMQPTAGIPKPNPDATFSQSRRGIERIERETQGSYDVAKVSREFEETSLVSCIVPCSVNNTDSLKMGTTSDEPALSEREQMETELIRRLISSYFNIVRETIADQVPKAIMHLLVNHSKDVVQNKLVTELYREEYFNDLLYEDDNIKAEREKCERLLETYRQAAKIVNDVV